MADRRVKVQVVPMSDVVYVDLRDDGVLWLMNRCLFHRVGYALGLATDGKAEAVLVGDGSEEWRFKLDEGLVAEQEQAVRVLLGDKAVDRLLANAGPESEAAL